MNRYIFCILEIEKKGKFFFNDQCSGSSLLQQFPCWLKFFLYVSSLFRTQNSIDSTWIWRRFYTEIRILQPVLLSDTQSCFLVDLSVGGLSIMKL